MLGYKGRVTSSQLSLSSWPSFSEHSPGDDVDLSSYKLRLADSVRAFFSVIVFVALAVLDTNTVECLFPGLEKSENTMLLVLPPTVGAVSSVVFALFSSTRHGIGCAPTSS
ncbi:DMP2-like protein [Drosera capensis]